MPAREVTSIFEQYIVDALVYLANGWASFRYAEALLQRKYDKRRLAMGAWMLIYAAGQFLIGEAAEASLYERIGSIVPCLLLLFFLQSVFFEKDRPRQAFSIVSFEAGWEILRFTASPIAHAIFSLWGPLWAWAFEQDFVLALMPTEQLLSVMEFVNRAVMFIVILFCRAVQVGALMLYLRLIRHRFVPRSYELGFEESLFLLFPCVTVLCIDTTMRLMVFSLDNGAAMLLVYDRVPVTLLLLPIMSLLLLGVVVSSVSLFRNLVLRKDEEQKRTLLENQLFHTHREMEELQDIYADIRGLRHDIRNHVAHLAAYVRKKSPASEEDGELAGYLSRMTETVERLDFADRTGNPITDIILHQARQQAKKKGIDFSADFHYPQDKGMDAYDVSVILGNALQNALEAGERNISVRSYLKGNLFFIETENDFTGELDWQQESGLPATTKPERKLHGIGLANIRRAAQKYQGDLDIQVKESDGKRRFCLTVMLYEKGDSNDKE